MDCILCNSEAISFFNTKKRAYFKCNTCRAVFMNPASFPSNSAEKERYLVHNNDVENIGYQKFVSPIVNAVLNEFDASKIGLDFGCGTGPVISTLLEKENFNINKFDPFFLNDKTLLKKKYDFIVCCEVIEHFHHPLKEFQLLKSLLKNNGKLYCMTDVFSAAINFENWYYKNDETHVIFYQKETFQWLKKQIEFSKVTVNNRLITFES